MLPFCVGEMSQVQLFCIDSDVSAFTNARESVRKISLRYGSRKVKVDLES